MVEKPRDRNRCGSELHGCEATKKRYCFSFGQVTTWLLAAQFSQSFRKLGIAKSWTLGSAGHQLTAAWANVDSVFQAWHDYSNAMLKRKPTFSSICHSKQGIEQKTFLIFQTQRLPPPQSLLQTNENCAKISSSAFYRGKELYCNWKHII